MIEADMTRIGESEIIEEKNVKKNICLVSYFHKQIIEVKRIFHVRRIE